MSHSIIASVDAGTVEGKTKIIRPFFQDPKYALVISKHDITAGDGARHDKMIGKARFANETTCNVFRLLHKKSVPMAFQYKFGPESFMALKCTMIPVEVVVRFEAAGSYLKRNPLVEEGDVFTVPVVEFFLKSKGKQFGTLELPCDDVLIKFDLNNRSWTLYHPSTDEYIGRIDTAEANVVDYLYEFARDMEEQAIQIGQILHTAWARLGCRLQDFKIEFGLGPDRRLLLADVIDCDSWRLEWQGKQLSKQPYRDGAPLAEVFMIYEKAARLSALLE